MAIVHARGIIDANHVAPFARELMRAHGGDLVLVSSTGAGTVFRLSLPAPAERDPAFSRAPG